ncbi:MAG: YcjX family protein [Alphaproteobacteria bacterium]
MNLLDQALDIGRGLTERRVRLGVTGLSDAGKTVFITALVHGLLHPRRMTRLGAVADGRMHVALLRPQPSQDLPRFPYEACVARLTGQDGTPAGWPDSTRAIAELRVSVRYRPTGLAAALGDRVLHLDLFDYPGEWLLDLGLLERGFADWSAGALALAREPAAAGFAAPWLDLLDALDPDSADSGAEATARDAAARYTAYLRARRAAEGRATLLGPGRFLLPGELEGSPLLTFCPLPPPAPGARTARGSLRALMEERFRAYRRHVVRGFHERHFARLDRQVVLVDLGAHMSAGGRPLADVSASLDAVLRALAIGGSGWLPRWLAPRIDRVLFAASKADHVPSDQHPAMEEALRRGLAESIRRTAYRGARLDVLSLAALRATREVTARDEERRYVAGRTEGDAREIAHFPGMLTAAATPEAGFRVTRFLPPPGLEPDGDWPHLRLDRALEMLIGDRLT